MRRLFSALCAIASTLLCNPAAAMPVPYTTILPAAVRGTQLGSTFDGSTRQPDFVYTVALGGPLYSFNLPRDPLMWTGDLTQRKDIQPLPAWSRDIVSNSVLPAWAQPQAMVNPMQVMVQGLPAGMRKHITADEVQAHDTVYQGAQGGRPQYRLQNPQSPGSPLGANVVYAFADFSSNFVQDLLDKFDWPGKPVDADGRLLPWSERSRDLHTDPDGNIDGAPGGAEIAIDGTLGVWIPAQTRVAGRQVFAPHDFAMDLVLINSKVAWARNAAVIEQDKLDFYSVALHETGHDLGLHHARAPEPATLALVLVGCVALRRRAGP